MIKSKTEVKITKEIVKKRIKFSKRLLAITTLFFVITSLVYAIPKGIDNKMSEVINVGPRAGFNMFAKNSQEERPIFLQGEQQIKNADLVVLTDYTGEKVTNLISALNNYKSNLYSKGINLNFSIIDGSNNINLKKADANSLVDRVFYDDSPNGYANTLIRYVADDGYIYYRDYPSLNIVKYNYLSDVKAIGVYGIENGIKYYYAIKKDGTVWKWATGITPIQISGITDVKNIYPLFLSDIYGNSRLAHLYFKNDGSLWAKGANQYGILGIGNNYINADIPFTKVMDNVSKVFILKQYESTPYKDIYVVKNDGSVYVWGFVKDNYTSPIYTGLGNNYDYVVNGDARFLTTPRQVQELTGLNKIENIRYSNYSPGSTNYTVIDCVFAIKEDGSVWYTGSLNSTSSSEFSLSYTEQFKRITNIDNVKKIKFIIKREYPFPPSMIFLKKDNSLWVWGKSLTDNNFYNSPTYFMNNVKDVVDYNFYNSISMLQILKTDGTLWAMGDNNNFMLFYNLASWDSVINLKQSPDYINPSNSINDINSVFHTGYSIFAFRNDGTIYKWGSNTSVGYDGDIYGIAPISGKISLNDIYALDIQKIQQQVVTSNDKIFLYISDGQGNDFSNPFGNYYSIGNLDNTLKDYLVNNNFSIIAVTPKANWDYKMAETNQQISLRDLVNSSPKGGQLFDVGQLNEAFQYIESTLVTEKDEPQPGTIIANEDTVIYDLWYDDYEKDIKNADRFRYIHDETFYNNSQGKISFDNQWLSYPVTIFDKVGKYLISYQAQDNPESTPGFEGYRKWSIDENQAIVYVHRRPIANFTAKISGNSIIYTENSYDLDHIADADKGITNKLWKWKNQGEIIWRIGQPTTINDGETIIVRLTVQDKEGVWSIPKIITLTKNALVTNNPPVADFVLEYSSMAKGSSNNIYDYSYDIDGDLITQREWTIYDSSNNIIYQNSVMPNLSTLNTGNYKIQLRVKDASLWSEPCVRNLTVVINNKPIANFSLGAIQYTNSSINVTDTSYDPDGDPIIEREWRITYLGDGTSKTFKDKLPKTLEEAGFTKDGQYKFELRVMDDPTRRNSILQRLWSDWKATTITVDVDLKLTAWTEKIISKDTTMKTSDYKTGQAVIVKAKTEGYAYKVNAYLILNTTRPVTNLVPDDVLQNPLQYQMTWHTKYMQGEGYDANMIIPLNTPLSSTYKVRVRAYRKKADGTDKIVTVDLPINVNGVMEFKTEIIK